MLVSVIMPVYRVEAFLPRAIESVLNQTLREFELILVDDGSPDKSGAICDEYAKKDARVRVIHQANAGAPAARNAAMEISCGKYRFFCDSDDWMEPDMLEKMTALAEQTQAELTVCGFTIDTDSASGMHRQIISAPDALYETAQDFRKNAAALFDNNLLYTPWNKLFLSERMDRLNIRFPSTFWDDFPFNLSYLHTVQRVAVTSGVYYHFTRSRAESETAKYVPQMYEKREEEDKWMRELYADWGLTGEKEMEFLARRYAERLVGCIENLTNPKCELRFCEKMRQIRRMLNAPRAKEALSLARPEGAMLRLMFLPLKRRWALWAWAQSMVISFVKTHLGGLFARLKASRGKAAQA
ncbi:MAG: glycosyltransferase family 2 protein [Clostridia bacterium]|nr:glycosyltransferase family 2 protein [Clostridia bacterium]